MKKPLSHRCSKTGIGLAVLLSCSPVAPVALAGNYGSGGGSGLSNQAEREVVRRQEDLLVAQRLVENGDRAMADKDYETAYTSYLDAVDLIGSGPLTTELRTPALGKFSRAGIACAEDLIDNGRYGDAERVAKTILLPQYNPTYKPAVALLSHLEQPDYYNKTVTTQFAENRDAVSQLLIDADGFFARGSFDLATKRYEQVLNIDRYSIAARKGMEKVEVARKQYYGASYNETRSRLLWQVAKGWELPVKKFEGGKDTFGDRTGGSSSRTEAMTAKLNRIIIPRIDLRDTTIREAVEYLRQLSVKLDTLESDPAKKGVNIFLKLSSAAGAAPAGAEILAPPAGTEPALPADGAAAPAAPEAGAELGAAPVAQGPTEDTQITLALDNVPLYEALRYLTQLAGLKIKIEPIAVSIVPVTEISDELITKEYRVPPTFIPTRAAAAPDAQQGFGVGVTEGQGTRVGTRITAREYLEQNNVPFPPGASANYIPAGSKLIVRNTQDAIDLIDLLVDAVAGAAPTQVEIESKFVEINQNNLKELGFDWLLGPLQIGGTNSGVYGAGGSLNPIANNYPFVAPGGDVIGSNPVTDGLRSGQGASPNSAVTINGLDALLAGIQSGPAPAFFGLSGIYTNPQFQFVIRALDQKKGVDLMTAPKVTTKSGAKAVINIIREFIYPTEFDPPQIPQTVGTGDNTISAGFTSSAIITPTTPTAFETRNTGVTLDVTPVVGPDGFTIDLELTPEVVDFDGFINYGTPILGLSSASLGGLIAPPRSVQVSPNIINQPVFSTRKVTTNVTIWDGMTVGIGGLIREDVQKVQDKVPILGDVPLLGRLFRSDVDQKLKKNLIIFVTARLMDAEGKPLRSDDEKEEIVEPLGLPNDLPPPTIQFKAPSAK